jgi:hypothetical protein
MKIKDIWPLIDTETIISICSISLGNEAILTWGRKENLEMGHHWADFTIVKIKTYPLKVSHGLDYFECPTLRLCVDIFEHERLR